jgi:hypothetical protein
MPYFTVNDAEYTLRRRPQTQEIATAVHEAAHGVTAMDLGIRVTGAEMSFTGGRSDYVYAGEVRWGIPADTDDVDQLLARFIATLAPRFALELCEGVIQYQSGFDSGLAASDWEDLRDIHRRMGCSWSLGELIGQTSPRAKGAVQRHGPALEAVTYGLLRYGKLSESDLRYLAGNVARRWETIRKEDDAEPASPPRRSSQPRPSPRSREVIPGLRYGDTAPIITRGRAA